MTSVMTKEREPCGDPGFQHILSEPTLKQQIIKLMLDPELELEFEIYQFHEDMAREIGFTNMAEHIAFCLKELARYWLEVDQKRFGEIMAEAKKRGHGLQNICLED